MSGDRGVSIGRTLALAIAAVGLVAAVAGIAVAAILVGLDDRSSPIIASLLVALAAAITSTIAALKTSEAADAAAEAQRASRLTAENTDRVRADIREHIASICPDPACPLKARETQI